MATAYPSLPGAWHFEEEDPAVMAIFYKQQLAALSNVDIVLPPSPLVDPLAQLPSKFLDKVKTNYIPDVEEKQEISEYVSTVNHELSQLNAKISEMQTALIQVAMTRDRLQAIANQHQALISPLRRLPPELLQIIFVYCTISFNWAGGVMRDGPAEILDSASSQIWRDMLKFSAL